MNSNNTQLAVQILIYVILFILLAFALWGLYRAYKQRQIYKVGVIMSLGAAIGALGGVLFGNPSIGLLLGIVIGFAMGAGLEHFNKSKEKQP